MTTSPTGACLTCGTFNNAAATALGGAAELPGGGDVSVCSSCAGVAIYTGNYFEVRTPTPDELATKLRRPEVLAAVARVKAKW